MNLKFFKVLSILFIFVLFFPFHYGYDVFPNSLSAIFFPVNESIWEHMKLIFTTFMIYGIVEYIIYNKYKVKVNNLLLGILVSSLSCIIIFLAIFLPIYYKIGENLYITLSILFVSIIFAEIISYIIIKKDNVKFLNIISIIIIIICYIIFGYFNYYPIKNDFFYDPIEEKYGINTYVL